MASRKSTVVGAFVLGGLGIAAAAIILFAGSNLFSSPIRAVAYFQHSVAGLAVGAPVTFRGVKVGTVQSITVYVSSSNAPPLIPVYMELDPNQISWASPSIKGKKPDLRLAVKNGLRAQLETQSLVTGQSSINLDFRPDTPGTSVVAVGEIPEIPTIPSDIQHLKDEIVDLNLSELVKNANAALTALNQIAGQLNGTVGPLADSARQTSDAARATLETATQAIQQLRDKTSQTLDSISELAKIANSQVQISGKDIDRLADNADQTVQRADKVIDHLSDLTAPRSPMRDDLEATLRDLAATASSLRSFSHDLEKNPAGTFLGRASR